MHGRDNLTALSLSTYRLIPLRKFACAGGRNEPDGTQ